MPKATDVFDPEQHGIEAVIRARKVAEQHFEYELSNDPDEILASMKSFDPMFTTILRDTGRGSNDVFRCDTVDEQREFYRSGREHMDMIETPMFTSIGSDWYAFVHGLTGSRLKATGDMLYSEIIGVLPTSPGEDTIAGEIGLSFPIFGKQGDAPGAVAHERVASFGLLQQWLAAVQQRDADELASLYSDRMQGALFDPVQGAVDTVRGKVGVRDLYGAAFDAYEGLDVELIIRLIDRWYIFAELRWRYDEQGEAKMFRTADVFVPTPENEVIAQLGIGTRAVVAGTDRVGAAIASHGTG